MKDIFDKPLKMIWGNDFNTHFRINKSDRITVRAYGWDKKVFFKAELDGIHTVKEAIDYVRGHISKELVGHHLPMKQRLTKPYMRFTRIHSKEQL